MVQKIDFLNRINKLWQVYKISYDYNRKAGKVIKSLEGDASKEAIERLKHLWADELIKLLHIELTVTGSPLTTQGSLMVGNHLSYLDIPILMSQTKAVFVAKKQVSSWPIIGSGCKKIGTIFVDRSSESSRHIVGYQIASGATENLKNIAVFPSGTTSINEDKQWKAGAFKIAHKFKIQVQPFRVWYEPVGSTAYIGKDFFPVHLFRLFKHKTIKAHIEFHEPILVDDPMAATEKWQKWSCDPLFRINRSTPELLSKDSQQQSIGKFKLAQNS